MIVLPAIDLKDGICVRLHKGDFSTTHQVSQDPAETAFAFKQAGAEIIHIVDLDGALDGNRKNVSVVQDIIRQTGLKIELGGGMRSMAALEASDKMGVYRMVIGSAAVYDPDFVSQAVREYGERIAVGIDAQGGKVRTHGWVEDSGEEASEFAKKMEQLGVGNIIYTDIETDGMLTGPSVYQLESLRGSISCGIIASGGVSNIEDIQQLREIGMDGAIIGKAYYSGNINLREAIKEAGK